MNKTLHGIVRGNSIEFDEAIGMAEGEQVEVSLRRAADPKQWGEGLRRCAGALASEWTDEDDRILREIHAERGRDSREETPE
jgi:hypothetical protein